MDRASIPNKLLSGAIYAVQYTSWATCLRSRPLHGLAKTYLQDLGPFEEKMV